MGKGHIKLDLSEDGKLSSKEGPCCGNCPFWIKQPTVDISQKVGACHGNPPTAIPYQGADGGMGSMAVMPAMSYDAVPCRLHPRWEEWRQENAGS